MRQFHKKLAEKIDIIIITLLTLLCLPLFSGQTFSQVKFSGYTYFDYYFVVKNHNKKIEDQNGIWFRRIYLTMDNKLNEVLSIRFRTEFNSPGDFTTKDKLIPFIKDVYLKLEHKNQSIIFGISPTPTYEVIEEVWGYRSVEKTPLDLQKFSPSRETGIAFKGTLDSKKIVNYHLMFANGNGESSENNKGKEILFTLTIRTISGLIIEGYLDYDNRTNGNEWNTQQGFIGYKTNEFRSGLQYSHQNRKASSTANKIGYDIFSFFMVGNLSPNVSGFLRFDRNFDANPDGAKISYLPFDSSCASKLFIVGLDFSPNKDVHIIPNAEIVNYDSPDSGPKPNSDFIPRLTIYYTF